MLDPVHHLVFLYVYAGRDQMEQSESTEHLQWWPGGCLGLMSGNHSICDL
jgi:hypothetical protein